MKTLFTVETGGWVDVDPLSFEFHYKQETNSTTQVFAPLGFATEVKSVLAPGFIDLGGGRLTGVVVYAVAIDSHGASASHSETIECSSELPAIDIIVLAGAADKVAQEMQNGEAQQSSSTASSEALLKNNVANGDSQISCGTQYVHPDQCQNGEVVTTGRRLQAATTCPVDSDGNICSGNGTCHHINAKANNRTSCTIGELNCHSYCQCHAGHGGFNCRLDSTAFQNQSDFVMTQCITLQNWLTNLMPSENPANFEWALNFFNRVFDPWAIKEDSFTKCIDPIETLLQMVKNDEGNGYGKVFGSNPIPSSLLLSVSNFMSYFIRGSELVDGLNIDRANSMKIMNWVADIEFAMLKYTQQSVTAELVTPYVSIKASKKLFS